MHQHQLEPAPQHQRPIFGGPGSPRRHRRGRGGNGASRLGGTHFRNPSELLARGGVMHVQGFACVGGHPAAVDEAELAKQQRIVKFHVRSPQCR